MLSEADAETDDVTSRVGVCGKFLSTGLSTGLTSFHVRGVTYGAFRPDDRKHEYHDLNPTPIHVFFDSNTVSILPPGICIDPVIYR